MAASYLSVWSRHLSGELGPYIDRAAAAWVGGVGIDAHKWKGIGSATIWTHVEEHDFIHVAVTGAPALQLHHLLEFESLYGELICQAFEKCALLRVARSSAHKDQIRGIGAEFVQFFP
ncbi:hypothetical protein [Bradyrhizobium sp. 150]|uniref:hypothetical protein n=1 Tax=Bradyrhizobium sp. 150 TaxID=2782625 RepID=UPI001FF9B2D8|nr:hypothetical protein [Bradyrhizobium sp. 150]MCK1671949.1 hypothetical protein [Bradyrhizobium sp. 150]